MDKKQLTTSSQMEKAGKQAQKEIDEIKDTKVQARYYSDINMLFFKSPVNII